MNILKILQFITVIGIMLVGMLSLSRPKTAAGFTGLTAPGGLFIQSNLISLVL